MSDVCRPTTPFPEPVLWAWQEAGAEVGWLAWDPERGLVGTFGATQQEAMQNLPGSLTAETEVLPTFRVRRWDEGSLRKLPAPPEPFALDLSRIQVTNATVEELTHLSSVRVLRLGPICRWRVMAGIRLTDVGLRYIARLKNLQYLDLSRTWITDAGLGEVARLKQLRGLDLSHTHITNAGLKELAGLKQLRWLDLSETKITERGLRELIGFRALRGLALSWLRMTKVGLGQLANLKKLEDLKLTHTRISRA